MVTITVGGLPGTGTSTLCRLLEQQTQRPWVYAGALFREEAARRGVNLQQLNELSAVDPSIDRMIDDHQVDLLRRGGMILEGRLAGWLAHHHGFPAFKVWVVCDPSESVRRLVQRDGGSPDDQQRLMDERIRRETERYLKHFGADPLDRSIYDLVLDSTSTPPDALVRQVLEACRTLDS